MYGVCCVIVVLYGMRMVMVVASHRDDDDDDDFVVFCVWVCFGAIGTIGTIVLVYRRKIQIRYCMKVMQWESNVLICH